MVVELPCPGPIRGGLGAGFADSSNMPIPGRLINPPGDESVLRFTVRGGCVLEVTFTLMSSRMLAASHNFQLSAHIIVCSGHGGHSTTAVHDIENLMASSDLELSLEAR